MLPALVFHGITVAPVPTATLFGIATLQQYIFIASAGSQLSSAFITIIMDKENILQFIPQRYPFVMVDQLLYVDETSASANFTITAGNIFCESGYFSEAGLLENIAQTVAAGNGYNEQMMNKKVSGGFIARVKNFEVFFLPKINDVLTTEIIVTGKLFNMTAISGKIVCNNEPVAQCEMKIFSNIND